MSEETATPSSEPRPASKRQRWLLIGSLALNLFFIGIAVAMFVREPGLVRPHDRSMNARIERIASILPEADAKTLREQFQANRIAAETARANLDSSREAIRELLRREPFDADAMREALAQRRAARQNYEQVMHGLWVSTAAKMTPQGRRELADWRSKWRSKWRRLRDQRQ